MGGFQKTILSGTRNRAMKKRSAQTQNTSTKFMGPSGLRNKTWSQQRRNKDFQNRGQQPAGFKRQPGSGNRVFVNRGQSYVLVAKAYGTGYNRNARLQNRHPVRQQVWRAPVVGQKYQNVRGQYGKRNSQNVRTGVHISAAQHEATQESQYQTRSSWTQSYGREYSATVANQHGLYRPPHRREDETTVKKETPSVNFRWGNFNKMKESGNFGKKFQRSFGNGSQGRNFSGF